uniref:Secreted protein n=1 Tax=Steinernema glaseri TaxID=37863 RepID=A0A1I7YEU4_9BILA
MTKLLFLCFLFFVAVFAQTEVLQEGSAPPEGFSPPPGCPPFHGRRHHPRHFLGGSPPPRGFEGNRPLLVDRRMPPPPSNSGEPSAVATPVP